MTASAPGEPARTPETVNVSCRSKFCPSLEALSVITTLFVSAREMPLATDTVTVPVSLSADTVSPLSCVVAMSVSSSFSYPNHSPAFVVQLCADGVTPSEVSAQPTISLSRSAMTAFSPSLLQRWTTAGADHSLHVPFFLVLLHPHSTWNVSLTPRKSSVHPEGT